MMYCKFKWQQPSDFIKVNGIAGLGMQAGARPWADVLPESVFDYPVGLYTACWKSIAYDQLVDDLCSRASLQI